MKPEPASRSRRLLIGSLALVIVVIGGFVVLEGLVSTALAGWDLVSNPTPDLPSRSHSVPDTLLGWVNTPGFVERDRYGPNGDLLINAQSFREAAEIDSVVPPGKIRVLCAGDSFTFGIGVANDETWCSRLAAMDDRIQAVNLGHAGFGIDQAALFYLRDGRRIDHDIVVLAFIPDDVRRLRLREFVGVPKPYFLPDGDSLALSNVPVSPPSGLREWWRRHAAGIAQLGVLRAANRLRVRLGMEPTNQISTQETGQEVALRVLEMVRDSVRREGREAVFVLLAEREAASVRFDDLARHLAEEGARRGLTFLDIRAPFRAVPADTLASFFLPEWGGHYSRRGHELAATLLYERLVQVPAVAERLVEHDGAGSP